MAQDLVLTPRFVASRPWLSEPLKRLLTSRPASHTVGALWSPPAAILTAVADEARLALSEQERFMAPAGARYIAKRVVDLLGHYWEADHEATGKGIIEDWELLLREFSERVIGAACIEWLKFERRRPTPSDIRTLCWKEAEDDFVVLERLRLTVRALGESGNAAA